MKEEIRQIVKEVGLETLTAKTVRVKLEQMQGLEPNALKSKKEEISELIDEVIAEMEKEDVKEEADADQGDEDESEEEEKPAKKAKTAPKGKEEAGGEKKPKMTCRTRSGEECPKGVKAMQEKLKITTPQFLATPEISIDVCGNTLTAEPRVFSSGNLGWYLGGKLEVPINGKNVWAQVGINITIPGSQSWKKK